MTDRGLAWGPHHNQARRPGDLATRREGTLRGDPIRGQAGWPFRPLRSVTSGGPVVTGSGSVGQLAEGSFSGPAAGPKDPEFHRPWIPGSVEFWILRPAAPPGDRPADRPGRWTGLGAGRTGGFFGKGRKTGRPAPCLSSPTGSVFFLSDRPVRSRGGSARSRSRSIGCPSPRPDRPATVTAGTSRTHVHTIEPKTAHVRHVRHARELPGAGYTHRSQK
jgi:hypothetical protein